ncbi:amino acid ABC transporter permease [Alteribacter natronophilus]|uniref:amino acid ABC transporter permease n=1 Tax=Alteribacter natronophilus TaxID=2583810 RepID=UPI00110DAE30|nr:amino acid ABC transporter permease [Alteribacter natronophilus]TMW71616.1 amino acid ABC transporter permease [Alteribacter natronophilus]
MIVANVFDLNTFFSELIRTYPFFFEAAWVTIRITVAAVVIGTVIGVFVALLKLANPVTRVVADIYITVIRGTPLIVQIFILFYGLTGVVQLSAFWAASFALAVHNSAYIAEIFRGAIQSIDKGQMEAGRSLGMTKGMTMKRIIMPQALRRAVPPLGNQFIIALKDSSLAAFVGIAELFRLTQGIAAATFNTLETYIIAAVYYLALVMILTWIVNMVERRLSVSDR